jgi:2-polyprenyl-3-methyl-5-hydroxy-6-metoxy-1,4-benzoquinol methylase
MQVPGSLTVSCKHFNWMALAEEHLELKVGGHYEVHLLLEMSDHVQTESAGFVACIDIHISPETFLLFEFYGDDTEGANMN